MGSGKWPPLSVSTPSFPGFLGCLCVSVQCFASYIVDSTPVSRTTVNLWTLVAVVQIRLNPHPTRTPTEPVVS